MDKTQALRAIREATECELKTITQGIADAREAARNAPSSMESHSDGTRREAQDRARALRTTERNILSTLRFLSTEPDAPHKDGVRLGSLVTVKNDKEETRAYLLVPYGGMSATLDSGETVTALSPESPLGHALIGKHTGDTVTVATPAVARSLVVVVLA